MMPVIQPCTVLPAPEGLDRIQTTIRMMTIQPMIFATKLSASCQPTGTLPGQRGYESPLDGSLRMSGETAKLSPGGVPFHRESPDLPIAVSAFHDQR